MATNVDLCAFVSRETKDRTYIVIYVDDGLIVSNSENRICEILEIFAREFEIKVLEVNLFLDIEIKTCKSGAILLESTKYINHVIDKFNMSEANSVTIPADSNQNITMFKQASDNCVNVPYREAIGSLLFLVQTTRPDIAFSVITASQFVENPCKAHWNAIKRIIKYLKGTINYSLVYKAGNNWKEIITFSDADFAGDMQTRRSMSGYIVKFRNAPVIWGSKKQKAIALSTTEAEFVAACEATKEIIWAHRLISELNNETINVPELRIDNQSAIRLIKNPDVH